MARAGLVAGLLLLLGCDRGSPTAPGDSPRPLPAGFRVTGSASSTEADGTMVSCLMDLFFELGTGPRSSPGVLEYDGVHGGGLERKVVDAAGNGIALAPDVHGEVVVRSIAPNRVEIVIPANAGAEGRFWRELSLLAGVFGEGDTAAGSWQCAPFDIDSGGYVDTQYTAPGSWTLIAMP